MLRSLRSCCNASAIRRPWNTPSLPTHRLLFAEQWRDEAVPCADGLPVSFDREHSFGRLKEGISLLAQSCAPVVVGHAPANLSNDLERMQRGVAVGGEGWPELGENLLYEILVQRRLRDDPERPVFVVPVGARDLTLSETF